MPSTTRERITLSVASGQDMDAIYKMRHEVYATELGQHEENPAGRLSDQLDSFNTYIVARAGGRIAGFVSITPPGKGPYSIDKYFTREEVPLPFDDCLYELRILTISSQHRGRMVGPALAFGALRWVEAHGGKNIVAIGRVEILDLYLKIGFRPTGKRVRAGAVTFELLTGSVESLRECLSRSPALGERIELATDWRLEIPWQEPAACYHGGAFFGAIGPEFDNLERANEIINADVLDAWFPPSPTAVAALGEHLAWAARTSPPTHSEGLVEVIARTRGVAQESVLPGAGSSSLIFLAFRHWLTSSSRALILEPSYGEYAHILENVVKCQVARHVLSREDGYRVDLERLERDLAGEYDLAVIVNPNNPTGRHVPREELAALLQRAPSATKFWIDEAYVDYAGEGQSLETFAAGNRNVVVCKSMSKAYALSGLRVGYLCGPSPVIAELRLISPPWAVSLPGQITGVMALKDPEYYSRKYSETRLLRAQLADGLRNLGGLAIVPGEANFLLFDLPADGPDAGTVIERCQQRNLFLRDIAATAPSLGPRAVRIAVKDTATNRRMVEILGRVLNEVARTTAPTTAPTPPG